MKTQVTKDLNKLFSENSVWMLPDLARELGYAEVSARRFLKQTGYVRSYTHNGKWYTLLTIAKFNRQGIWQYGQIGFSKHITLLQTLDHLIHKSPSGLSAAELSRQLNTPCQAVVSSQYKAGKFDRIKPGPEYIYLSKDTEISRRQRSALLKRYAQDEQLLLTAEQAVFVLVQYIRKPSLSFEKLSRLLQKRHKATVSAEHIEAFFQKHHIKKNEFCRS